MQNFDTVINQFTEKVEEILKENLTGIYLHGSSVMGCFNPYKSDLDFIIIVNHPLTDDIKKELMELIIEMNAMSPEKGLEISVVNQSVCKPFLYPTPFELHFSPMHLHWYLSNPMEYIEKMNGEDKDLAAHFTVIYHRGKCLAGLPIESVFDEVPKENYMDSIWEDVKDSKEDILGNPMYFILNLTRVLAYKKDGSVLSKKEGGTWALTNLPEKFSELILTALSDYERKDAMEYDQDLLIDYADYMLNQIRL